MTYYGHRTEIGDPKPEKKEKPKSKYIKKVSDKRSDQMAQYKPMRLEFLKLYPKCQFEGCECKSIEVHHKYSGKDRSKFYLDDSTWMAICRKHHAWIHAYPKQSRSMGYLM